MPEGVRLIKQGIAQLREGLENSVNAAAKDVGGLGILHVEDYVSAILDRCPFTGDTTEVYLYTYTPESEGFPKPGDRPGFLELQKDLKKLQAYEAACYDRWKREMLLVQEAVARHRGKIKVNNGLDLEAYFGVVERSVEIPHRVHVQFSVPGQEEIRLIRKLEEVIAAYEASPRIKATSPTQQ